MARRCVEPECPKDAHSRGLCSTHYSRHRSDGTLSAFPNANEAAKARPSKQRPKPAKRRLWSAPECLEDGCQVPPIARNLCAKHYQRAMVGDSPPPTVRVKLIGTCCRVSDCTKRAVARGCCQRHASQARRYGLSIEQMAALPTTCEACGSTHRLHVDHNHTTGLYRGVLCSDCNTAFGLLGDDTERIMALLEYARKDAA